jgi:hypothetical protein
MSNIFDEPKSIKKWAVSLANACGGQKVTTTPILTKLNTKKIGELLDKFVEDHNENTTRIAKQIEEEE